MCKDCKVVMARRTYFHGKCKGLKKGFDIVTPDGSKGSEGYKKLNTWRRRNPATPRVQEGDKRNETETDTMKKSITEDLN